MLADTLPQQRTWPTLAWAGAGAFALVLAQLLGVLVYVLGIRLTHPGQPVSAMSILHSDLAMLGATIFSAIAIIPLVWGLTRVRTRAVAEYLALQWPTKRRFSISMAWFVAFMVAQALLSRYLEGSGDAKFMLDLVSSARTANEMPLILAAVVIAAPLGEELAFRGFLYRTLELKFGGTAAVVVTALGWAALHIQYSLTAILVIFAGGLLFGAIRRYSGSLYLTMVMHALWNGAALAGALLLISKA
jgi:membrane protease YdiL (CAAX protease family)